MIKRCPHKKTHIDASNDFPNDSYVFIETHKDALRHPKCPSFHKDDATRPIKWRPCFDKDTLRHRSDAPRHSKTPQVFIEIHKDALRCPRDAIKMHLKYASKTP